MEKNVTDKRKMVAVLMKAMLISYIFTGVLLAVLAYLLYKLDLSEKSASFAIFLIYIITCFVGGFLAGKMSGKRKFFWGLLTGGGYIIFLTVVSLCVNQSMETGIGSLFVTAVLCVASGTFGGMVS